MNESRSARGRLLAAIEAEMTDAAERRAIARLGDPGMIAVRLREARPRRLPRALPALAGASAITALLALAGSLGHDLAPQTAAAASPSGPSMQGCAQAFDGPANRTGRARIRRARVLAVQIFPTPMPSCVIKFQLSDDRVLTAIAAWASGTASSWRITVHASGRVAGSNARWAFGRLTATAISATRVVRIGPPPTTAACVAAWNSRAPVAAASLVPGPVVVRPLPRGTGIVTWGRTSSRAMDGPGCTVSVIEVGHGTRLFYAPWDAGRAVGWLSPGGASGILGPPSPNADLTADGRLTLR